MIRKSGFTLLEILIVVVIAISITAFAVPAYKKAQERNNFLAAKGILMDLGAGLQGLRGDLVSVGIDINKIPQSPARVKPLHMATSGGEYTNINLTSFLGDLTVTDRNILFALFVKGYMQRFELDNNERYKGYALYVCPENGSGNSACCRSSEITIACMRIDGGNACYKSNYPGAYITKNGEVVDIPKKSDNFCNH